MLDKKYNFKEVEKGKYDNWKSKDYFKDFTSAKELAKECREIAEKLKAVDVNTLTPIEALQMLYELKKEAETV